VVSARYKVRWEHVILIVVVVAGLAARLYEVRYSLDFDEIFSVELARKPFAEVIAGSLEDTSHPPLHIVVLHMWITVFGASDVSVRALSVLFSGVFLLVSHRLFRRLAPPWVALGLVSILALSPEFVYCGQRARPYALIAFLAAVNLLAFIRVLEAPHGRRRMAVWAVSCAFLLYAQYLAVLLIACQIGVALFCLRSDRLTVLSCGSAASALIVPWLIAAMGGRIMSGNDPLPYIAWMEPPTPTEFVWFYVSVFGDVPGLQARWLLAMLAFLGIAYLRHFAQSRDLPAGHLLLFLLGIGVPIAVYVISVWGPKPVFASRQLLGAAIAFLAVIGLCMTTLPRTLAAGFLLALLLWTVVALPQGFPHNMKPPWRDVATRIDEQCGSTVVAVQEMDVGTALAYYRRAGSVRLWSELTEDERSDGLLFLCRPHTCSLAEAEALR
jgi:uncharacterized membrane protein